MLMSKKKESTLSKLFDDDGDSGAAYSSSSSSSSLSSDSREYTFDADTLDLTSEEPDFEGLALLIAKFQSDERVRDALEEGVDMRDYGAQVERELATVQRDAIDDYLAVSGDMVTLYEELGECDSIMASMEGLLDTFQGSLESISIEIKLLQQHSSSMSVQVKNRRELGSRLSEFIDDLYVSPELVRSISRASVDEAYIEFVGELHKRMAFAQADKRRNIRACADMRPHLEKLRARAVDKVSAFLLEQFRELRTPKANVAMLQSARLLKYNYFTRFLRKYASAAARDVRNTYVTQMSAVYASNAKYYVGALLEFVDDVASSNDLLATSENSLKSFFTSRFAPTKGNVFTLGTRDGILSQLDAPILVPEQLRRRDVKLPIEVLFRSLNHYLMEAVTSEHRFDADFFGRRDDVAADVFERSIALVVDALREQLENNFDAVGILIMIRIAREGLRIMAARRVPTLHRYFESIAGILWPRFTVVFNMHAQSVLNATPTGLGSVSLRPHYVTRRYAEFVAALVSLRVAYSDRRLAKSRMRLCRAVEQLVVAMSKTLGDRRQQAVFLINNYDLVLGVLEKWHVASDEQAQFTELLHRARQQFVSAELVTYLRHLVAFVRASPKYRRASSTFAAAASSSSASSAAAAAAALNFGDAKVAQRAQQIVADFAERWEQVIKSISQDILAFFPNFQNGSEILKLVFMQLVVHYGHFEELMREHYADNRQIAKHLVPPTTLTYSIGKFDTNFSK
jgi:vacuolar protein sorting-associated protein 52